MTVKLIYECPKCGIQVDIARLPEDYGITTYCTGSMSINTTTGTLKTETHDPVAMMIVGARNEEMTIVD